MTGLHPDDWRVIKPRFDEMFGAYRTHRRTNFKGPNFMTPEVLGILDIGGTVEVSTGFGLDNERIYGVTWNRIGTECDPRDRLCWSLDEVREYLMTFHGHHTHGLP